MITAYLLLILVPCIVYLSARATLSLLRAHRIVRAVRDGWVPELDEPIELVPVADAIRARTEDEIRAEIDSWRLDLRWGTPR